MIHRTLAAAGLLGLALVPSATSSVQAQSTASGRAVYVSPTGSDAADGRGRATAFRSLERAQAALKSGVADTVYLTDGVFRRSAPLQITGLGRPQSWLAAPGAHPVLDGGGRADAAIGVNGADITVAGLRVTNFAQNGIVVLGGTNVTIRDNRIDRIASSGWNTAAIMVMHYGKGVTVARNSIADTGYVGIGYFAGPDGDLSGARILDNELTGTCRKVADCGAIYIIGRTPTANGAVIRGNHIDDYGPAGNETKAIYLDDNLSGAEVSGNVISGRGSYAIQLHGGSGNRVVGNTVTLSPGQPFLFHQELPGRRMTGNVVSDNIVRGGGAGPLDVKYGGASRPTLRGNRVGSR